MKFEIFKIFVCTYCVFSFRNALIWEIRFVHPKSNVEKKNGSFDTGFLILAYLEDIDSVGC